MIRGSEVRMNGDTARYQKCNSRCTKSKHRDPQQRKDRRMHEYGQGGRWQMEI
jgi:hypothetical protein